LSGRFSQLVVGALAFLALVPAAMARPGVPDDGFDGRPRFVTHIPQPRISFGGLAPGPRGGSYVVANTESSPFATGSEGGTLLLVRYDRRGRPVRGFGDRGTYSARLPAGRAKALGMLRQADGKLVVVGSVGSQRDRTQDVFIARFYPDGSLDGDFGDGGIRTVDLHGSAEAANDVAALPGGGFAIVGTFIATDPERPAPFDTLEREAPFVAKVRADGSLDVLTLPDTDPYPTHTTADAVAVGRDGTVFVAGNAGSRIRPDAQPFPYVARLAPGGSLSIHLGQASPDVGYVRSSSASTLADLAFDRERGILYLAGSTFLEDLGESRMWAAAFNTDLTGATGFGSAGFATADFAGTRTDLAVSALVDRRGRVVLAGAAAGPPPRALDGAPAHSDFALARLTRRGRLDRAFGRRGLARVRFRPRQNVARELIEQAGGRLLVAGTGGGSSSFPLDGAGRTVALARLDGD
jgi:uncharacterized delta-60 repeat protein